MEFTIPRKSLFALLGQLTTVAERKSTMPVLSHVHIAAEGPATLRLSATDLYLGLSGTIEAEIATGGSMAVPAKELLDRIKMMPDGPLTLAQDGKTGQVTLRAAGRARKYVLRGLQGTDFPTLPTPAEGAPSLSLEAETLETLIAHTAFSVSQDETRAHLNSALFEWEGETVRMVSTDGHRLSKMEVTVSGVASASMLIPLKAVLELKRICEEAKKAPAIAGERPKLTITQSGSSAFFQAGTMTFSAKLTDAQFPPYAQVIPKSTKRTVTVPRAALAESLRAVAVASNPRTGGVKLTFSKDGLRVSANDPEGGDATDEVQVDYDEGAPLEIGFNAKYVLDVLGALSTDEVAFGLTAELEPMVVKDGGFVGCIMPMRVT